MQTNNDAMSELWRVLSGTQTAYETALTDLDDNAGKDLVTKITLMRKANIEQVEKYLSDAGTDVSELEAPERVYSALDWTSAGIDGPDGVKAQVRKYEANVLEAYDRAIEPYAAGDPELQFLTEQYHQLSQKLGGLTPDRAVA
ncbi:hypothetical protein SAMN04488512_1247 [Sulfitobacter litoralis]|uniref:DUF2383 domain-containing protein n=1 Tax=Sulfitobacter litoralis TaxID=335975 RepID=A0ABY0SUZ6_9RHOB|nr:hypothetical protein [Sulfitobacter litoralis]SDP63223.1 hypothetical protein SAMN04488512_1247 [Sulfitobacter litoralis]